MQPNDHLIAFRNKIRRSRLLLARQVAFHARGQIPKTELDSIFELSFLNAFVAFENDVTELFKTNLLLAHGSDGRVRSIFVPSNRADAQRLLVGTQRYFQLLPVEQMEKIAKVYLKDGKPFTTLTTVQKAAISKSYAIRNHIAHNSSDSKRAFKKRVLDQVTLQSNRQSAGFYLRSSLTNSLTYFDHHLAELGGVMRHLCEQT